MTTSRSRISPSKTRWLAVGLLLVGGITSGAAPATATAHPPVSAPAKSSIFVVPAGVTSIVVDMAGSIGLGGPCDGVGGFGGRTLATIPVTPGETLQVNIAASAGGSASGNSSDLRRSPYGLEDRLVVAGGGGWNADHSGQDSLGNCTGLRGTPGLGGDGGGSVGVAGNGVPPGCGLLGGGGGGGGTQNAGGAGGAPCGAGGAGTAGGFGTIGTPGGSGTAVAPCSMGGSGGSGWYGGGGGAGTLGAPLSPGGCTDANGHPIANPPVGGGGGGGSSYVVPEGTGVTFQPGVNGAATGWVTISEATLPAVTAVSPAAGSTLGGRSVTITGTNLTAATAVRFGATPATKVVVVSSGEITVRAPAHAAGVVHVRVETPVGTSASVGADRFTYLAPPTVTGVSPAKGPSGGGTTVTLRGAGFTGATKVTFGTKKGTHLVVVSATKITVRAPAHAAGKVDVRVTSPGGRSAKAAADRYTYR